MKIVFYIDGQNAHYSFKALELDSHYFNFRDFCQDFVKNWRGVSEVTIKYYGAIYPRDLDEYKHHRDNHFFDNLEKNQKIIVRKGKISFDRPAMSNPREKGVDVLLAVDLIIDGFHNHYDQAIIFSNDTDLIPAIIEAKKIKTGVKVHNLSLNPLHDFRKHCDNCFQIYESKFKKYCKPENTKASGDMLKALEAKFPKK